MSGWPGAHAVLGCPRAGGVGHPDNIYCTWREKCSLAVGYENTRMAVAQRFGAADCSQVPV